MRASLLCDRGDLLKALGIVAPYLANALFYGFFRTFADSSNGAGKTEKAARLAKYIDTSPTGECLSNISERAEEPFYATNDNFAHNLSTGSTGYLWVF
jgi:hypothetical protein